MSEPSNARDRLSQTQRRDLPLAIPTGELSGAAWTPGMDAGDTPGAVAGGAVSGPLRIGQVLSERYEIQALLGAGGMGAVYSALDRVRREQVAIKVLLPRWSADPRARDKFHREGLLSTHLSHPRVVRVFDIGRDGELSFLSMELLGEGRTLRQEIQRRRERAARFEIDEVLNIGRQLCEALDYAHGQKVLHLDVKPENVWLKDDGSIKLMDFGIARTLTPGQMTATSLTLSTAYYMAPEQLRGDTDLDGRADQYSTAVVVYELLTGEVPQGAVRPPHEVRKSVPKALSIAVMKGLAGRKDDRHADNAEFGRRLIRKKLPFLPALKPVRIAIAAAAAALLLLCGWQGISAIRHRPERIVTTMGGESARSTVAGSPQPLEVAESMRLLDFDWLERQVQSVGIDSVISHYPRDRRDPAVDQVRAALDLSAHILRRDLSQLWFQLHARTLVDRQPAVTKLLSQSPSHPQLKLMRPSVAQAGGPVLRVLQGHNAYVFDLAITPDGHRVVSGSKDKMIRVWDLETGKLLDTLVGHDDAVLAVAVTPDGRKVVSGSWDGTVKVWDLDRGALLETLVGSAEDEHVTEVAITLDGRKIISGASDGTINVWDLETGNLINSFTKNDGGISALAVTHDGRRLVSGGEFSDSPSINIWDLESGALVHSLKRHKFEITAVAVTPDGRRIISGDGDSPPTVRVWDLEGGALLKTLEFPANSIAVLPDGRRVVSSYSYGIKIWDLESGHDLKTYIGHEGHNDFVQSVAVTPEGRYVVSASLDGMIKVWDLKNDKHFQQSREHGYRVVDIALTNDERYLLTTSMYGKEIDVWDVPTGKLLRTFGAGGRFDLTPDSQHVVTYKGDVIQVWDLQSGDLIESGAPDAREGNPVSPDISSISLMPNGRQLAATSKRGILICDIDELKLPKFIPDEKTRANELDVQDPIGFHLALVRSSLKNSKLFEFVFCAAISPNARLFAIGGAWGYKSLNEREGYNLTLWDIERGEEHRTLVGHNGATNAVAFTPYGREVISGGADKTIRIWDANSGALLKTLSGHEGSVTDLAVTPNGRRIISGSTDQTIRIWDLRSGNLMASACVDCEISEIVVSKNYVFAGDSSGRLYAFQYVDP